MLCCALCGLRRRHPACMVMLHHPEEAKRQATVLGGPEEGEDGEQRPQASGRKAEADVFDAQEEDPAKTRAVESSLWEIEALKNHYAPQVRLGLPAALLPLLPPAPAQLPRAG